MCRCDLRFLPPTSASITCGGQQPHIGGEVAPHQDSTFLATRPASCLGLWWALEGAARDNGCLWVLRGSHKQGLQRRYYVRDGELGAGVRSCTGHTFKLHKCFHTLG